MHETGTPHLCLIAGRTPEYLGKKIQGQEVKLAAFGVPVIPITVLVLAAIAVSVHADRTGLLNAGPIGFPKILYAFTSVANNNGSAFAGISVGTAFCKVSTTFSTDQPMSHGRFF
jgi:K+-transporting ATPase ATPase A chain